MRRSRILFQGSHKPGPRGDTPEQLASAMAMAAALGRTLIREGFDLVLTGGRQLDAEIGNAATQACAELNVDPRERIRTYPYGDHKVSAAGFGMVLEPIDKRWQEVRTFLVREADGVVAVVGGKGTSDVVQKAVLAKKPVFPIAVTGGAARQEWERLRLAAHANSAPGDIDFLADRGRSADAMAAEIARHCRKLLAPANERAYSRRIFIVHGHDAALKSELARFLEALDFEPVILHEQPDRGKTIAAKLHSELDDVGFAFILLTPDDVGAKSGGAATKARARQNVIFEHGLFIGALGPERVCALVSGDLELPSDIHGVLYKSIPAGESLSSVCVQLARELRAAGYDVDGNKLIELAT